MAASMASKFDKYWGESNNFLSLGAPMYIAEIKEVLTFIMSMFLHSLHVLLRMCSCQNAKKVKLVMLVVQVLWW